MTITPVDAVQWVRSRPQQFFGDHDADALKLFCFLMADVIELGVHPCDGRRIGRARRAAVIEARLASSGAPLRG